MLTSGKSLFLVVIALLFVLCRDDTLKSSGNLTTCPTACLHLRVGLDETRQSLNTSAILLRIIKMVDGLLC